MMKINRAIDFDKVSIELSKRIHSVKPSQDISKLFSNIQTMVTDLSKEEVVCRRSGNFSKLDKKVEQINKSIGYLEKLILLSKIIN